MQLYQKGLLNINDTIAKYIPDYPYGEKISIHHLLNNSSGIPCYTSLPGVLEKKMLFFSLEKLVETFKNEPLKFTPGKKYDYSNSGYILLTHIIEKVSEKSYATYLNENIFQKLGMINSGYDDHETILRYRASGYFIVDKKLSNADYIDTSIASGAGALFSTVEDLYLWDQALYTEKLIRKDLLDKIFNSSIKIPKEDRHYDTQENRHYGYGWVTSNLFGRRCIWHGGNFFGYRSYIGRYTDDNACIIVLSNFGFSPVEKIAADLATILFEEH